MASNTLKACSIYMPEIIIKFNNKFKTLSVHCCFSASLNNLSTVHSPVCITRVIHPAEIM